jgi:hypothetical protein
VQDRLPTSVSFSGFVSVGSASCSQDQGAVLCVLPRLAPGDAADIVFRVIAPMAPGTLVNTAVVDPAGTLQLLSTGNHSASASTVVAAGGASSPATVSPPTTQPATSTGPAAGAGLRIEQTVTPNPARPGAAVTFSVTVSNDAAVAAAALELLAQLPPGVDAATAAIVTAGGFSCRAEAGVQLHCTGGTVPAGAQVTMAVTVQLPSLVGTLTNIARLFVPIPVTLPGADVATPATVPLEVAQTVAQLGVRYVQDGGSIYDGLIARFDAWQWGEFPADGSWLVSLPDSWTWAGLVVPPGTQVCPGDP